MRYTSTDLPLPGTSLAHTNGTMFSPRQFGICQARKIYTMMSSLRVGTAHWNSFCMQTDFSLPGTALAHTNCTMLSPRQFGICQARKQYTILRPLRVGTARLNIVCMHHPCYRYSPRICLWHNPRIRCLCTFCCACLSDSLEQYISSGQVCCVIQVHTVSKLPVLSYPGNSQPSTIDRNWRAK